MQGKARQGKMEGKVEVHQKGEPKAVGRTSLPACTHDSEGEISRPDDDNRSNKNHHRTITHPLLPLSTSNSGRYPLICVHQGAHL
jgi:hypothetical protein